MRQSPDTNHLLARSWSVTHVIRAASIERHVARSLTNAQVNLGHWRAITHDESRSSAVSQKHAPPPEIAL